MKYATFLLFFVFSALNCGSAFKWKKFFNKEVAHKLEELGNLIPPIPWISHDYTAKLPKTVQFHLYTRLNRNESEVYEVNVTKSDDFFKSFNPQNPTKIVIHGWMGHLKAGFCQLLKNTYLDVGEYNVIVFDWSKEAKKFYKPARDAVPKMGQVVADFIDLLVRKYSLKSSELHLIGHSLGAHVSGIAGHLVTSGPIGRITGLDPALPLFSPTPKIGKLTNESAAFVDVIHTCGLLLGFWAHIGHADFYPNQGIFIQPGCGADVLGKCSHRRAYYFFAESIQHSRRFIATKCDHWLKFIEKKCGQENVIMGEHTPTSARGVFYLLTASKAPYGKGEDSIKVPDDFSNEPPEL